MREIKVWAGTHPDETRALEIEASLRGNPIAGVHSGIVNLDAHRLGRRQVDINMIAAYPGNLNSHISEERRAPEVLKESQGYYSVIDLHDIGGHGEDTAWIGTRGVRHQILGFLAHLGIKNLVRTNHNSLHEHVPNSFLLEIAATSERSSSAYLREAFHYLAHTEQLPTARASDFSWFTFLTSISKDSLLPSQIAPTTQGFERLPPDIASLMGHPDKDVHMLGWNDQPNENGYWAEVGVPISTPDETDWPLSASQLS